jgi:hypothetical protein
VKKYFSVPFSPISERAVLFRSIRGCARLSFWYVYMYGALMECYWQEKIEVLGEKPVSLPLCAPQISHGLNYDGIRTSAWEAWSMDDLKNKN